MGLDETRPEQFQARRYPGIYRGTVADNLDQSKLGRLRIYVPEVFGIDAGPLDWATPVAAYGGNFDRGFVTIPEIGAGVWIMFESGDPNRPVWMGTWWSEPTSESEVPRRARGLRNTQIDEIDVGALEAETIEFRDRDTMLGDQIPPTPLTFSEPASQYGGVYPDVKIFKSARGNSIEIDDTPKVERLRFYHRTGSYEEFRPEGSVTQKALANFGIYVGGQKTELIQGDLVRVVEGRVNDTLKDDVKQVIGGKLLQEVVKDAEVTYGASYIGYVAGDQDFRVVGGLTYVVDGNIVLSAGGNMQFLAQASLEQNIGGSWRTVVSNSQFQSDGWVVDVGTGTIELTTNVIASLGLVPSDINIRLGEVGGLGGEIKLVNLVGNIVLEILTGIGVVKLGGSTASQSIVLGELFKAVFDAHTHPVGPPAPPFTGPPVILLPPGVLSTTVKSTI